MPIYEYVCDDCHHKTESLRRMSEADHAIDCEACGSRKTRRVHSLVAVNAGGGRETALAMSPCGRCGDPNGSCPMR